MISRYANWLWTRVASFARTLNEALTAPSTSPAEALARDDGVFQPRDLRGLGPWE